MKGKKLYKVDDGKMLCGVCMGISEYFDTDVTLVRLLWIILSLFGGSGIILYICCAIIFPKKYDVIK